MSKAYLCEELKEGAFSITKNDDLICKNCIYKCSVSGVCVQYPDRKPLSILNGGKCDKKKAYRKSKPESNPLTLPEEKARNIKNAYIAEYRRKANS